MSSANFEPKRTAAASRGFLATARLSCLVTHPVGIEHLKQTLETENILRKNDAVLVQLLYPQLLAPANENIVGGRVDAE